MNILILGSGGREHALAWAIRQNPKCDRLIVIQGLNTLPDIRIARSKAFGPPLRQHKPPFLFGGGPNQPVTILIHQPELHLHRLVEIAQPLQQTRAR